VQKNTSSNGYPTIESKNKSSLFIFKFEDTSKPSKSNCIIEYVKIVNNINPNVSFAMILNYIVILCKMCRIILQTLN